MYNIVSASFGEIFLKGKNRGNFEHQLVEQIKFALKEFKGITIYKDLGKVFIETTNMDDMDGIIQKTRKIFGIVSISGVSLSPFWLVTSGFVLLWAGSIFSGL